MMHIFPDNFHQGGRYNTQIASHQAELKIEGKFTDQKSLSISYLQSDDLNIDTSSSSSRNNEGANLVQAKCTLCGGTNHPTENIFEIMRKKT